MKLTRLDCSISIKKTKNFNSISLTEGFSVEIEKEEDYDAFEKLKMQLKAKLDREVNDYLDFISRTDKKEDFILEL